MQEANKMGFGSNCGCEYGGYGYGASAPSYGGGGFVLIVVLFILLIIVGASWHHSGKRIITSEKEVQILKNLKALILNCSLKPSNEKSNTDALLQDFIDVFEKKQVETETIRVVDYNISFGVDDDMGNGDEWPVIANKIEHADILLVGTPIWLGEKSSVAKMVMERISGSGSKTNASGQPIYYNKVAGAVVTGNEDGAKHAARDILFSLGHYGFSLPPNPLSYWVGEAGPGASYIEAEGYKNKFTKNNAHVASNNLVHLAVILANNPIPTEGNVLD
uniref:NADPH-dependent FMN reductase-like domain-containing protein n=1 Tax=Batrachochytrium dendrobatidis (strain JAM81 / FGSC 10211) TaxID=684364 RepID=F4PFX8_BATDJ|eukprot:XP_006683511.1 hypothetical protein BATDEDRAFT_93268 [Batrachochytrium dendrobatidis JAM81]